MSARPKLAPVPAATPPKPRLRRVTLEDAARAHPGNAEHARRWLRAVGILRTRTRNGWVYDKRVIKGGSKP